ncbi:AAA family ATPase [Aeromicrobium sp. YIM 150415]|uniref:AAA family ATPase n=1 Tax=Aeromicrobium sp. YIM 150415 TaxID=2803912 RepID=UPI0019641057|nr:AAA family ATPase [Aeromicrobium sp. YIM 150415]MBM9464435.1 AAA family ATPase [Aeromicrobium sp. YIM 150415]
MSGVLLIVGAPEATADRVSAQIGFPVVALTAASVAAPGSSLLRGVEAAQLPAVIVFADELPLERSLALAAEVREVRPDVDMILIGRLEAQLVLEAMRAGIRDVAPELTDAGFLTSLRGRMEARAGRSRAPATTLAQAPVEFSSRVMTVLSPKGGVGKTSLSVNLAVALAESHPMEVVLVDLDLQFGDVSTVLGLDPAYTLADAFESAGGDSLLLKTFLTVHPAGFYVLCGADSPAANDTVPAERIRDLLLQLQSQFRYVLIDTSAGIDEATLAALEVSHDAIVVSSMDMACLRSVRKGIELLGELKLMPASRHVVVNFADKQSGLRIKDIEAVLGVPADFALPRTKDVQISANRGVPLLSSSKGGPFVKAVKALAQRIYERARATEPKPGHRRVEVS